VNAKRFVTFICACSLALLMVPSDAAAQRSRGGGGHSGQRAVPRGSGHPGAGPSHGHGGPSVGHYPAGSYRSYGRYYYRPYYRPYYYSPYWYNGFYASFYYGLGWYPYYASQFGYPCCGYPYPAYAYRAWSSARLEIKPRDAQVYVDGYFVGVVDEFDGVFQRLDLPAGEHEIAVYMPGYQTYREKTLFRPGEGYHYKAILEPLPPGAAPEPKPQPQARAAAPADPNAGGAPYPPPPYDEPGRTQPMPERGVSGAGFGTLNLRVQPGDAVVQIDGERWDSPEGGSRLSVQLAAGSHRIEVSKDGYRPYTGTVDIRPGAAQAVNIVLPLAGGISGT
jgi:hypothetical protein